MRPLLDALIKHMCKPSDGRSSLKINLITLIPQLGVDGQCSFPPYRKKSCTIADIRFNVLSALSPVFLPSFDLDNVDTARKLWFYRGCFLEELFFRMPGFGVFLLTETWHAFIRVQEYVLDKS